MKKIAVYFTGHYRNLNETWVNYSKLFKNTDNYTFDFYFFLWNISDHDRVYTKENDKIYQIKKITENDIIELCKDVKLIKLYEDFVLPESKNKPGAKQMFIVNEAFKYLPNDYDYYVRMRTDLFFFKTDIWNEICSYSNDLILPNSCWGDKHSNFPIRDIFNDLFWVGNYKGSKFLSMFYEYIDQLDYGFTEDGITKYIKSYANNITIRHFDDDFNLDRRTRGYEPWLTETPRDTQKRQLLENK